MDGSEKKLSIITINLDNKEGLQKTIRSVITQTFTDYEYIVIDGASSDGSPGVIDFYKDKIIHGISEKDSGIYNAMNKGIRLAKGEYCLFLNSGDYLYSDHVLEQIFKSGPNEDIVYGDMMIDYGNNKMVVGRQPEKISFEFMVEATLWHPVSFIKKKLLDESHGYNENYKIVSDYEFFIKTIILKGVRTRHVPVIVAVFNTKGIGSSEAHDTLHQQERNQVLKAYFSTSLLETAKEFNRLKRSLPVTFAERVNNHSMLKFLASVSYRLFNKVIKFFGV
jgi:glycosyltransferase involved in cell wall biosynthesis